MSKLARVEEYKKIIKEREFTELRFPKKVKIKKENYETLKELMEKYQVDIGAIIDEALEKFKIDELLTAFKELEKKEHNQN